MKYAGILKNDFTGGPGLQLTFFVQGCPHHCPQCQNPETWDFEDGQEFTAATLQEIISGISANGIQRCFGVQGGEPLCENNLFLTSMVIREVRKVYPEITINVWTGYELEDLKKSSNPHLKYILETADYLIDGPYVQELRDITLKMRGSKNQRIINLKTGEIIT